MLIKLNENEKINKIHDPEFYVVYNFRIWNIIILIF